MKRVLTLLFMVMVMNPQPIRACDACACSISGSGLGLLANYKNNLVGLSWSHARFQGLPLHGEGSTDDFNALELSVRYHISKRLKIQFNQPYRFNNRHSDESLDGRKGIGDSRFVVSYSLLKNLKIGKKTSLFFELGAGVKLPLGAYDKDLRQQNLPENFNIGNGSWAYLIQPNLLLTREKMGLVINGSFQFNEATKDGYTFGNQTAAQALIFCEEYLGGGFSIVPNLGVSFEKIAKDIYVYKDDVPGTGGKGTFGKLGANLKYENWNLAINYALPIDQNYSDQEVEAKGRMNFGLSYIF